jgi:hypothetical protein
MHGHLNIYILSAATTVFRNVGTQNSEAGESP